MHRTSYCTFFTLILLAAEVGAEQQCETIRRIPAPEAVQAVAVDSTAVFAIANSVIAKYDKTTGKRLAEWRATNEIPLRHLNSGVVIDGKLYCAHSNFPKYPNTSSVEIFDAENLVHVGTHSFGIYEGSLTVVDWHGGAWWCVFAHYSERVNDDARAKPHTYTSLVKFDDQWRRTAGWVFPPAVLERFDPHSCSGGVWGADGRFYATGHDRGEVYQLELPASGSMLKLTATYAATITGQGIAWDRDRPDELYGINRPKREVVVSRLPIDRTISKEK